MNKKLFLALALICFFSVTLGAQVFVHAGVGAIMSDQIWEPLELYGEPQGSGILDIFGASVAVNVLVAYGRNLVLFADETFGMPVYVTVNRYPYDTSRALMRMHMDTVIGVGAGLIALEQFRLVLGAGVHNHMFAVMSLDYESSMPILPFGLTLGAGAVLFADIGLDERTTFFIKASAAYDFLSIYGLYKNNGGLAGTLCAGVGIQLF